MSQYQNCKVLLILKPQRERSSLRRHPWIFSGAVAEIRGPAEPGDTVIVQSAGGKFLAWAAYSPHSQITARIWSWDPEDKIGEAFFHRRLAKAIAARRSPFNPLQIYMPGREPPGTEIQPGDVSSGSQSAAGLNALRLVHAESDGLPGLIVDRYADTLVMQFLSAGAERWRDTITQSCLEISGARGAYERSDVDVRRLEGLPERSGMLAGEEPPERIVIREPGSNKEILYEIDVRHGHKTAHYLDQRANRMAVGRLAQGREVLDCFCYTGGFAMHTAAGKAASVLAVDASAEALAQARQNWTLNGLPGERMDWLEADVFQALRSMRDARRTFDMIILDPPKFAQTASQAERAARGYKDINLLAFKLLRPGGLLVTFSCSGGVSEDLFQKIVAGAALDAGVEAQILERMHQAPDHPVALNFPEGAYLKGLVILVPDRR
jgi:23S rRNA (cytosine1962-C5)-methyltransferase